MDSLRRLLRGGSGYSDLDACRAAYRGSNNPDYRFAGIGFRLVGVEDGQS